MTGYQPTTGTAGDIVEFFLPVRKANYVVKWFQNPCSAPFHVYVETFGPAFLEVFIFMLTLTPEDLAKSQIERRTKRAARRRAVLLGRRKATKVENFVKHFWKIEGLVERGLFWWAVVDLTVEGAYRWTVLMDQTIWCSGGGNLIAEVENSGQPISDSFVAFSIPNVIQNTVPWFYTGGGLSAPRGDYQATLAMSVRRSGPLSPGNNFQVRLRATVGGEVFEEESAPVNLSLTEATDIVLSLSLPDRPNTSVGIGFQWRIDPAGVMFTQIEDATFTFSGVKKNIPAPPPYDFGTDDFFSKFGFGPEQLKDQFGKDPQDLYKPIVPFSA